MASTKISELSAATTLTGAESIPVVQGGVTKKVSTGQFLTKDASGNVGVGTASPVSKVHVEQYDYATAGLTFSAALETGRKYQLSMVTGGNFALTDTAAAVQRLVVDASGNLGLAVTPSAWSGYTAFQVGSQLNLAYSNSVSLFGTNNYWNGSAFVYKDTAFASQYYQYNGAHVWNTAPSGTAGNAISFTQAMALNASGVLTLTPTTSQAALFNYSGGAYTTWQHSGTSLGDIGAANQVIGGGSSADFAISSRSGSLVLGTANGVERATLAADGRLTLGAATNGAIGGGSGLSMSFETGGTYQGGNIQSFAGNTLNINPLGNAIKFGNGWGQFDASGNLLVGTTSTGINDANCFTHNVPAGWFGISHVLGTASGTEYINFGLGGVVKGSITQNGTTGVNYNTSSDARLKENISNADNGSALIDGLQVRKFDWKSDGSHQRFGFVAQELDAVYPEAVSKPADPDEMMGVDYSKLVPLLVQEIQSLRARVAALETV